MEQEVRETLINEIVEEVMSQADDLTVSCGCGGGCKVPPDIPPIGR